MFTSTLLVSRQEFAVRSVACRNDNRDWCGPELASGFGLVLARRGGFRRRTAAGEVLVDPTMGYLTRPDEEEQFVHPAGGDHCTALRVSARLWHEVVGERPVPASVYVDARLDLDHRLLVRAARGPDPDFAAAERLVAVLGAAGRTAAARRLPRAPSRLDRAAVESAREALRDDHPDAAGLLPLSRRLGISPYRLSRSFHALVGVPLTRYRNRLRVGRAMDQLEQGADNLAALAAGLGFADQAHLSRTVRAQLGCTPSGLRRLLQG
ncbi:MAG TPA: AraC family transcriptional regulator [Micromonosporaceae bacterium]